VDGTAVGKVYRDLDAAWQKDARVEFGYKGQPRTIEPAAAVVRAGRYYLVGRDITKGGNAWRTFSMDLIEGPIRRVGSFTRKVPPAKYLSNDAIGFFKGDGEPHCVDVTFSKDLAASAVSRKWQQAQKIRKNDDGKATISFVVDDVDEVVRWALGFGDEAWVSAPAAVICRAREIVDRVRSRYR
jgi:predicted DNA-binding transcriptional regulator YafY